MTGDQNHQVFTELTVLDLTLRVHPDTITQQDLVPLTPPDTTLHQGRTLPHLPEEMTFIKQRKTNSNKARQILNSC